MALPLLSVKQIRYPTDAEPIGCVWYIVTHDDGDIEYYCQPFILGASRDDADGKPLWGWNGNHDKPSILGPPGQESYVSQGQRSRVHLTYRDGAITLHSDATVRLA